MKLFCACGVICCVFVGLVLLAITPPSPGPGDVLPADRPRVLAVFPPLYCFAASVAGEHAEVECLMNAVAPLSYHPMHADLPKFRRADLFLAYGLGVDPWSPVLATEEGGRTMRLATVAEVLPAAQRAPGNRREGEPHAWLDLGQAVRLVEKVRDELTAACPRRGPHYDRNAARYAEQLRRLHEEGKRAFAAARVKTFFATQDGLGDFARSFGLEVLGHPAMDPRYGLNVLDLAGPLQVLRERKSGVLTSDAHHGDGGARHLKAKLDPDWPVPVTIVPFDTLETAPDGFGPDHYVRAMRGNIERLAAALKE